MEELTAYFITTDRAQAAESLASLEAQELLNDIVVVRNVRPLAAAMARTLSCPTDYCAVVDDDVLLRPGVVAEAYDELRAARAARPRSYFLVGDRWDDRGLPVGGGGFKLYHLPQLRRVGFPDAPHVHWAQQQRARALGLEHVASKLVIGRHAMGDLEDVYSHYLWVSVRFYQGQLPVHYAHVPDAMARRAASGGGAPWWAAAVGAADGLLVAPRIVGSKREGVVGPIGEALDLGAIDGALAARRLAATSSRWKTRYRAASLRYWTGALGRRARAAVRRRARRLRSALPWSVRGV